MGHLSNTHLALCDQLGIEWDKKGKGGEDTEELSRLIGVAVDFAKHGKCVEHKSYEKIEKKLKQWPDYMETGNRGKDIVQSGHILGKLYRGIDTKKFYKKCIEADHARSISLMYSGSSYILRLNEQNDDIKILKEGEEPIWHQHLEEAYKEFVAPMNQELRKLMVSHKILNEGELFCTNLMFNLDDESHTKLIGDPGQKDDDAVKALNMKIKQLMEEY